MKKEKLNTPLLTTDDVVDSEKIKLYQNEYQGNKKKFEVELPLDLLNKLTYVYAGKGELNELLYLLMLSAVREAELDLGVLLPKEKREHNMLGKKIEYNF